MPRVSEVRIRTYKRKKDNSVGFIGECSEGNFFINVYDDALKQELVLAAENGVPVDLNVSRFTAPSNGSFVAEEIL